MRSPTSQRRSRHDRPIRPQRVGLGARRLSRSNGGSRPVGIQRRRPRRTSSSSAGPTSPIASACRAAGLTRETLSRIIVLAERSERNAPSRGPAMQLDRGSCRADRGGCVRRGLAERDRRLRRRPFPPRCACRGPRARRGRPARCAPPAGRAHPSVHRRGAPERGGPVPGDAAENPEKPLPVGRRGRAAERRAVVGRKAERVTSVNVVELGRWPRGMIRRLWSRWTGWDRARRGRCARRPRPSCSGSGSATRRSARRARRRSAG